MAAFTAKRQRASSHSLDSTPCSSPGTVSNDEFTSPLAWNRRGVVRRTQFLVEHVEQVWRGHQALVVSLIIGILLVAAVAIVHSSHGGGGGGAAYEESAEFESKLEALEKLAGTAGGFGSCAKYGCGGRYRKWRKCQCNSKCEQFQTCCDDYDTTCASPPAQEQSCKAYTCGGRFKKGQPCQCNSKCTQFNTCCSDYAETCTGAPPHPQPRPDPQPHPEPRPDPLKHDLPAYRTLSSHSVVKGIAYSPSPETVRGALLPNDDFMSGSAAMLWAPWGRGDLASMSALGANTVRLYGNDPSQSHSLFLDEAARNGLNVIAGMSDWPYLQMPGNCRETQNNCFLQIREAYTQNLLNGFIVATTEGKKAYHQALRAVIIINEPEIGKFDRDTKVQCKVVASALDAMLQAERDVGVTGNPVAFIVTYSYANFYGHPALGQMEMLHKCMHDPRGKGGYEPQNDITTAYLNRFVNSFNTYSSAQQIQSEFLDRYATSVFVQGDANQIPVLIGEYHAPSQPQNEDLPNMLSSANSDKYPFFLGFAFFEFQARYDKAENAEHEMTFGMFGLDTECTIGVIDFFGKSFPVHSLTTRMDKSNKPIASALARAYGGDGEKVVGYSCKKAAGPPTETPDSTFV